MYRVKSLIFLPRRALGLLLTACLAAGAFEARATDLRVDGAVTQTNNGVILDGDGKIEITSEGSITVNASSPALPEPLNFERNTGILLRGAGSSFGSPSSNNTITNNGEIIVSGANSEGVNVVDSLQGTNNTLTNHGLIRASGSGAIGVLFSPNSMITNNDKGIIETLGDNAGQAIITGPNPTIINNGLIRTNTKRGPATILIRPRTGEISTGGKIINNARGRILHEGELGPVISIQNRITGFTIDNAGEITASGADSRSKGVDFGDNSANSNNTLNNSGTITTNGDGAQAVLFGPETFPNNSTGNKLNNTGTIETKGDNANAVQGDSGNTITNGKGGVIKTAGRLSRGIELDDNNTITNDGTIETTGRFAYGIEVDDGNRITIGKDGKIKTSGFVAHGISAGLRTGNNTIINNGEISVSGDQARGISGSFTGGAITNNGRIITSGPRFANGINVSDDRVKITNNGVIHTKGKGQQSRGISADNNGEIINNGTITTEGLQSDGIKADNDNTLTLGTDSAIATEGANADGLVFSDNNRVTNDGAIKTSGDSSQGMNGNDSNAIVNNGSIDTAGDSAQGIKVANGNQITNNGRITTSGDAGSGAEDEDNEPSAGIHVLNDNRIANTGTVTTSGADAAGIYAGELAAHSNSLSNSGRIVSQKSHGILSRGTLTTLSNTADSAVAGSGTITGGSTGITAGTIGRLTNSGTIRGSDAAGVILTGTASDALTVTNSGTIQGGTHGLNYGSNVIGELQNNDGTIQGGSADAVTAGSLTSLSNSGTIASTSAGGITLTGTASGALTVTNSGTIQGGTHGLNYGSNVIGELQNNNGTIQGGSADGLTVGSLTSLSNSGTIASTSAGGITLTGTASGALTVTNSGTIQGGTHGLDYGTNAIDELQNNGGRIVGGSGNAVTAGSIATVNNSGEIRAGAIGIASSGDIATLRNTADSAVAGSGTIVGGTAGITANFIARLYNTGTITGSRAGGVTLNGTTNARTATLDNSGTIQGGTHGIDYGIHALSRLTNSGTIRGSDAAGVTFTGTASSALTVTNSGTIQGGTHGLNYGSNVIGELQNNNGTIQGGSADGLTVGSLTSLSNSGTIASTSAGGVTLTGTASGALTVTNSGTIQGGTHGLDYGTNAIDELQNNGGRIVGGSGNAVTAGSIATVNNSGEIRAGAIGIASSGDITTLRNTADSAVAGSGTIVGGTAGITANFIARLYNTGTITGSRAGGVSLNAPASRSGNDWSSAVMPRTATLLDNSGRITGQTHGVSYGLHALTRLTNSGTITGGSADGLTAGSLTTLSNSGTITSTSAGGVTLTGTASGSLTVINSGTIQGGTHGLNYGSNVIGELQNNDGTIQGGSADGLTAGSLTSLSNSGTIASTSAGGVTLTGTASGALTVTNSGTIQGGTHGLNYGSNVIGELQNNDGTIQGGSADAVTAGSLTSLSNSGTIASTSAGGVTLTGTASGALTVTNSGTIQGGTHGLNYGSNVLTRLSNSGTLRGAGGVALRAGNIATLNNTGTIEGRTGILLERRDGATGGSRIEHSGLLRGSGGTALELRGPGQDALVLRAGARLEGELRWDGDGDTLHYADSASAQLTFFDNDALAGSAPTAFAVKAPAQRLVLRSTATSSEFGRARTTLTFLDPSLHTLGENALSSWTGAVAGIVAQQGGAGGASDGGQALWLRPFGSAQRFARDGLRPSARHRYRGALLGYSHAGGDWLPGTAPRFGLFFGAVDTDIDVRGPARDRQGDHLLAGAYLHSDWRRLYWHAALTIGESRYRSVWQRVNNLAAGGTETLRTDYKSRLLSAQLGLGGRLKLWGLAWHPAVQLRYLAQFTEDHDYRSGDATAITLRQREVHIGLLRAQLGMPLVADDRSAWQVDLRLGVEGRTRLGGGSQRGLFGGQQLAFQVAGAEAAAGFFGAGLNYTVPDSNLTFSADLETRYDSDEAFAIGGQMGVVWGF